MLFIADIPPMTDTQVSQYEYYIESLEIRKYDSVNEDRDRIALTFLKQANFLKMLAETQGDIRPTAESLAISNYLAYLRYMEKAGE